MYTNMLIGSVYYTFIILIITVSHSNIYQTFRYISNKKYCVIYYDVY